MQEGRDVGQERCWNGEILERRYAGQERRKTGGMLDRRDVGQERCKTGGMLDRRDETGEMIEKGDAGQARLWTLDRRAAGQDITEKMLDRRKA